MIPSLDASAMVKRYWREAGSDAVVRPTEATDLVGTTAITYPVGGNGVGPGQGRRGFPENRP